MINNGKQHIVLCDYHSDFKDPESGVGFHYFNSKYNYLHTHNYWEVFIITLGELYHTINGERKILKAGDCFIIRPNDTHIFEQYESSQSQHVNFMVTDEIMKKLLSQFNPEIYNTLLDISPGVKMHLEPNEYAEFSSIINRIYMSNSLSSVSLMKFFIINAVKTAYLKGIIKVREKTKAEFTNRPQWLQELLERMKNVDNMTLSIAELTANIGFSDVHIARIFKEYMHATIGAYYNEMKLNYACQLLKTTNFTILEICSRIGYSSLSHFNRVFKDKCKYTPKAYRKEHF